MIHLSSRFTRSQRCDYPVAVPILADKYDIEAARSRLQPRLVELVKMEPLRVYAIACRSRFEDKVKIVSSHTTSIDLSELTRTPNEPGFIPATEYHRLVRLPKKQYRDVTAIAIRSVDTLTNLKREVPIAECVSKGASLDDESFTAMLKRGFLIDVDDEGIGNQIRSPIESTG